MSKKLKKIYINKFDDMKRILIVEDDGFISAALVAKLTKARYEVLTVPDGTEVAGAISQKLPDAILLDLLMPKMDGFAVLDYLKKDSRYKSIPVIILTNLSQEEDRVKAMASGASDYLVKTDLSIIDIVEKIKRFI